MTPELQAIVDEAYKIFAPYRIGSSLVVCHCDLCMDEEIEHELVRTPLREIPANVLAEYTNSAHEYDAGQVATELRYFLPRYLELIGAYDPPCHLGLDICLRRVGFAKYQERWPRAEADVLDRFFEAFLRQSLSIVQYHQAPAGPFLDFDLGDVLTLAITAGCDVDRLIETFEKGPDPETSIHAAGLATNLVRVRGQPVYNSPYLEEHLEEATRIGKWLIRPETAARIEKTFFENGDPDLQKLLSRGLDWIRDYS